jgi:hypothetical protein
LRFTLEATKAFKEALFEEGIPLTAFLVDHIAAGYARLEDRGVVFRSALQRHGVESMAVFDDTCGNWIMICQSRTE